MRRLVWPSSLALLVASLLAALPLSAQQVAGAPPMDVPQIVTTGRGESRAAPDQATVEFSVQTRAATAAEAASANATRQRAVLDALRKSGIPAARLSTSNYSLHPEMRYDREGQEPRVVGYVATHTIRAELRRIDQVGPVIDAAIKAGANMVSSLVFGLSNAEEVRRAALSSAVANARAEAEAMAAAAGGSLGRLLSLSSAEELPPRPVRMAMAMGRAEASDAALTPVSPGEQTVMARVTAQWEFVPSRR